MKKDTKKVKPGKTDKPEKKSKKQVKKAVEEPKATKTRKSRKVTEEPEVKPKKQPKSKKVAVEDTKVATTRKNREVVEKVTPTNTGFEGMSLDELRKERHHLAAKISSRKKAGKDIAELKEQETAIVAMIAKIKYAGTPTSSTKVKTKNVVEEPTRAIETPKTLKVIRVAEGINMDEQPNNEIWYTTNDGKPANITVGSFGKGVVAISNTFDGKNGVIRCNGVITSIGHLAFYGCRNLASVILPESVEEINTFAFAACENLVSMTCKPTTPPLMGLNIFGNTPNKCTIHVKPRQVKVYKNANGWATYKNDIQSI